MKKIAFALLTIVMSFTTGLAVMETGLRVATHGNGPSRTSRVEPRRKNLHFRFPWRSSPLRHEKTLSSFRIVAVGDSFTWGAGVHMDDPYPARLERRLQRVRPGKEINVLNFGVRGYNTVKIASLLQSLVFDFQPDLILYGYCLNDPEPTRKPQRDAMIEPVLRRSPSSGLSLTLHEGLATYRYFYERLENTRQRRAVLRYYGRLYDRKSHWFRQCRRALVEMKRLTDERHVPLLVVIFPVFDSSMGEDYPYRAIHEQMTTLLSSLGIPNLDLLEAYDGIDGSRLAVTPFTDPHPNELAHRIAADRIVSWLTGENLLPPG